MANLSDNPIKEADKKQFVTYGLNPRAFLGGKSPTGASHGDGVCAELIRKATLQLLQKCVVMSAFTVVELRINHNRKFGST